MPQLEEQELDGVALVIGNSNYKAIKPNLANPGFDAVEIANKLDAHGFTTTCRFDLDQPSMDQEIKRFIGNSNGKAAMIYFAGHGTAVGKESFLLPIDARMSPAALRKGVPGFSVSQLASDLAGKARVALIFVDACRNDATRDAGGPAPLRIPTMGAPPDVAGAATYIAFSATSGEKAWDGVGGRNSPFAHAVIESLKEENVSLDELSNRVMTDVNRVTSGTQHPIQHVKAVPGTFYFGRGDAVARDAAEVRDTLRHAFKNFESLLDCRSINPKLRPDPLLVSHAALYANYMLSLTKIFDSRQIHSPRVTKNAHSPKNQYKIILRDIYRGAREGVFATSTVEYGSTWHADGHDIMLAHKLSGKPVNRVFLLPENAEHYLSDLAFYAGLCKDENVGGLVTNHVYQSRGQHLPEGFGVESDCTLVDDGRFVGFTEFEMQTIEGRATQVPSAKWHFRDRGLTETVRRLRDFLLDNSTPLDKYLASRLGGGLA